MSRCHPDILSNSKCQMTNYIAIYVLHTLELIKLFEKIQCSGNSENILHVHILVGILYLRTPSTVGICINFIISIVKNRKSNGMPSIYAYSPAEPHA